MNLKFRIVRFIYKSKVKRDQGLVLNEREEYAKKIVLELLKKPDSHLYTNLMDESRKARYIKHGEDSKQINVVLTESSNMYQITISNHDYFYDISLRDRVYRDIVKIYDKFLYNKRVRMEKEMLENINENQN